MLSTFLISFCILSLSAAAAAAAETPPLPPPPATCNGKINSLPITLGDDAPIVNTTANGSTKRIVSENLSTPLFVIHVYGSIYEMNYAAGQLMSAEIAASVPDSLAYLYAQVNSSYNLTWLPEPVRDWIVIYGVETALDWTFNATLAYTPSHWNDAFAGLSDGSGVDIVDLRRVAMIAEWTRAQCSMLGAWGAASSAGALVQLRALDWDTDGPFQQWPLLTVYHPTTTTGGVANAALGWAGMLGAITGVSSSGIGISEKVWDAYKGVDNAFGYVWNFLLADSLMFDQDTDQVLSRIATANRTCAIWIGLGDSHGNGGGGSFKAVSYSNQLVNIYNDVNFPNYTNHDKYKNLVFINKHVQPSDEPCMNDCLLAIDGNVTGLNTFQYVTALEQTGDMHIAVYDWGADSLYVANASPDGKQLAYDATFVQFTMSDLWNKEPSHLSSEL